MVCWCTAEIYQWTPVLSTVAGNLFVAYRFGCPAWFTTILSASAVSLLQVWFLLEYELPGGILFGTISGRLATVRCSYCSEADAGLGLYCRTEPTALPGLVAAPAGWKRWVFASSFIDAFFQKIEWEYLCNYTEEQYTCSIRCVYREEHGVETYLQQLKQNAAVSFVYCLWLNTWKDPQWCWLCFVVGCLNRQQKAYYNNTQGDSQEPDILSG
jgi:hypothetical protein